MGRAVSDENGTMGGGRHLIRAKVHPAKDQFTPSPRIHCRAAGKPAIQPGGSGDAIIDTVDRGTDERGIADFIVD